VVSILVGGSVFVGAGTAGFSAAGLMVRWEAGGFVADESGRASCEDIIAGSTGAPGTVGWLVGGRRAGGVYLLDCPLVRGR